MDELECEKHYYRDQCGANADCKNTEGSYECLCKPGYENWAVGTGCANKNECDDGTYTCGATELCKDTEGSYECVCEPGYHKLNPDGQCERQGEFHSDNGYS